jgi:hypothetical protein
MDIKTIPLSSLEANPSATLNSCADSGEPILVELPDHRLIALQPVPSDADESLIDDLLASNTAFQSLVEKSKTEPRKTFIRATDS